MRRFFALLLLVVLVPASAAPVPKEIKKAPTTDGMWEVVENSYNGESPKPGSTWGVWQIDGDKITIYSIKDADALRAAEKKPHSLTYRISRPDPQDATAFDLGVPYDSATPETLVGRMELAAETLKLCYASTGKLVTRPAKAEPGKDVIIFTFRRVEVEKK